MESTIKKTNVFAVVWEEQPPGLGTTFTGKRSTVLERVASKDLT